MHMCHNRRTSSRSDVEVDLESHVPGNRACVVWGRADEKGPSSWYLVSRLFHSAPPSIHGASITISCLAAFNY